MTDSSRTDGAIATAQLNDLTVAAEFEDLLRGHGLDTLDALFSYCDGEVLTKPGLGAWRERLRITLSTGAGVGSFYLKRFRDPPRRASLKRRRSGSGASSVAGREWAWLTRFAQDGIASARPVAFGEELVGARELRSAILIAAAPGESLEEWAARWGDADLRRVRALIDPTAALVARLHGRGFVHRDLYLSHVFFDPAAPPESCLTLIDLQRVVRPQSWRTRWLVKDLAALSYSTPRRLMSRSDRIRWLKRYLGLRKLDGPAKRLVYRITGKIQGMARHDRRRRARQR